MSFEPSDDALSMVGDEITYSQSGRGIRTIERERFKVLKVERTHGYIEKENGSRWSCIRLRLKPLDKGGAYAGPFWTGSLPDKELS